MVDAVWKRRTRRTPVHVQHRDYDIALIDRLDLFSNSSSHPSTCNIHADARKFTNHPPPLAANGPRPFRAPQAPQYYYY